MTHAGPVADPPPLLAAIGVTVRYPGTLALDGVDFAVRAGEVHALMGENGAGKSTLTRVLSGNIRPSTGTLQLNGHPLRLSDARDAETHGISTVHQELDLIPTLSVADNICLGRYSRRFGLVDQRATRQRATQALLRLGLRLDVTERLDRYPIATQQLVALSRALDIDARVLILDEPTSSLDTTETARLFTVVRRMRDQGMGIVFITHFLGQVYALADRITVLRNGVRQGEWATSALPRPALITAMTGRAVEAAGARRAAADGDKSTGTEAMRWDSLGLARRIAPSSGTVTAGESVGLAGLRGAGRTELARLLFGADHADQGAVTVGGTPIVRGSVRASIAAGLALSPEDRQTQGLVLDLSVEENIVLAFQARLGALHPVRRAEQQRLALHYVEALGIRTPGADVPVRQLSGGNQQKVLLARWLALQPQVLILDQPTRGIDVGSRGEIEQLIATLTGQGLCVILISDELDELVRLADRVLVLRDRAVIGELTGDHVSEPAILAMIAASPVNVS